ncbi:hypothetical protein BC827DRAFT_1156674 [Russula dissimulans]|nr:hypothetical protein BC827DRAFT_1156674 [Russula dissimulans]
MSPPMPPVIAVSAFQSSFSYALRSYKKRTREDLLLHPLAARLQSCDSPRAALSVLHEQAQAFDQSPSGEERLTEWLGSTVNVLYSLSSSLGEGVGLVLSPAKVIFVGIGVLFSVTQAVHSGQDVLISIFKRMENLFQRLEVYEVPPTISAKDTTEKIMLAVFSIITTVTEEIKQGRTS